MSPSLPARRPPASLGHIQVLPGNPNPKRPSFRLIMEAGVSPTAPAAAGVTPSGVDNPNKRQDHRRASFLAVWPFGLKAFFFREDDKHGWQVESGWTRRCFDPGGRLQRPLRRGTAVPAGAAGGPDEDLPGRQLQGRLRRPAQAGPRPEGRPRPGRQGPGHWPSTACSSWAAPTRSTSSARPSSPSTSRTGGCWRRPPRPYASSEHYGFIVAGKFYRGNHRGGGRYVGTMERDRVRALQLMQQALALTARRPTRPPWPSSTSTSPTCCSTAPATTNPGGCSTSPT